ncbi:superinfection immunity protein, partial [Acetobacter sp.]|uniref:superinfection immunity protein n=1 Tax=Acetobacter sp. TaxID=440 RepID=UPI0039EB8B6C
IWQYLFFLIPIIVMYFLPIIIAYARDSSRKAAIAVVNVFLGWTFVGWIAAIVMAFSFEKMSDYKLRIAAMQRIVSGQ